MRLDRAGSFFFDDVRIPARNMIGKENDGFIWARTIIGYNPIFVPLACIGAAQKSLEETIDYVKQRQVMGRSLSKWAGRGHRARERCYAIGGGPHAVLSRAVAEGQGPAL